MKNQKQFSFVITTIRVPELLEDYHKTLESQNIEHNFIIVPDSKTPKEVKQFTEKIDGEYLDRNMLGIENDDAKRMEGILRAIERDDDFIILLDDDNYLGDEDFYKYFSRVGELGTVPVGSTNTNWVNGCEWLDVDEPDSNLIYPRGFPVNKYPEEGTLEDLRKKIVVNAGLWKKNADVDAFYSLADKGWSWGLKREIALGKNNFCPFNSQNTAILTETLGGYYFPPKHKPLKVGRYGDIFAGLFYEKVMHELQAGTVLFGKPLSEHKRNNHNLLKDLEQEVMGMIIVDDLVDDLEEIELTKRTWHECLVELLDKMLDREQNRKETIEYLQFYRKHLINYLKQYRRVSNVKRMAE